MFDFNEMIHQERSECLRALPPLSGTVLSAGCAGAWYFDWFSKCTQHSGRHIGLELYSPKPEGLPAYVDWIANSVEHMEAVADATIDCVFSGQNVEHLAASSLSGFINESSRVLKDGGLLVVDSPNRSVTQHLGYAQPEHSLELTVDEIAHVLVLGGFEVQEIRGIWLVLDPQSNQRMEIGVCKAGELSAEQRQLGARSHPLHSFIWWVNARKRAPADAVAVRQFVEEVFWNHYSGFVSARFRSLVGRKQWAWGTTTVELEPADNGFALFGPYIPLVPGRYVARFSLRGNPAMHAPDAEIVLDVVSGHGTAIHASQSLGPRDLLNGMWTEAQVPFELNDYATAVEARCHVRGFSGSLLSHVDFLSAA